MREVLIDTPRQVYNFRVHFAALVASFAAMIIGYDAGFIGGTLTLPEFLKEFKFDEMTPSEVTLMKANIISFFHVGAFFGSYLIYPVSIFYGRILAFKVSGFFITFGSAIQLISNAEHGLSWLLAGRLICGIGIGAVSNISTMYISEISPPNLRGRLIGMYEICWQIGGVFGFFINYGTERNLTDNKQWQVPIAIQIVPAGIFFIGVFFIKESPRWYFINNQRDKAIDALCYLRGLPSSNHYVAYELEIMELEIIERKQVMSSEFFGPFKLLFLNKHNRYKLLLTLMLFVFQNTSGINAIIYYSVSILKTIGIDSTEAGLLSTGVFGLIKGVCCFIWAFFIVDNFGRKPPVMIGGIVCVLSLFYLGAYIKIADPENTLHGGSNAGSKSALAFFYIWTVSFAFSWSGFPWVYMSEVFDQKVKNLSQSFNASSNWFWAFIFARYSQEMIEAMQYGIFLFFGSALLLSITIFYFLYPETRNIPIDDIDLLFAPGVKPWKAHARAVTIIRDRELNHTHEYSESGPSVVVEESLSPFDKADDIYIERSSGDGNSAGSLTHLV